MGGARDDIEAMRWLRSAGEGANALAQDNLAQLYERGEGVAQDDIAATEWYRKAAAQGIPQAQQYLDALPKK